MACGLTGDGCSTPSTAQHQVSASPSPVQTVYVWLRSVDHKELAATVAQLEPGDRSMMAWGGDGPAGWPTFSGVLCDTVDRSADEVALRGTYAGSQAPDPGNPAT